MREKPSVSLEFFLRPLDAKILEGKKLDLILIGSTVIAEIGWSCSLENFRSDLVF